MCLESLVVGAGHGVSAKECNLHCAGGGSIIKGLSSAACSILWSLGAKAAYRMRIADAQHAS